MADSRPEHPAAYACRLYNDRLARSGSNKRWVTTHSGEMRLMLLDQPHGARVAENGGLR